MLSRLTSTILLTLSLSAAGATAYAQSEIKAEQSAGRKPLVPNVRVAVLDLGASATGVRVGERVTKLLSGAGAGVRGKIALLDRDLGRAAARGTGYAGSLNMTLAQARSLGASIGCDFYLTGDAQTIRRSSSTRPIYFESYASIFIVSTRTGRLVFWDRPSAEAEGAEQAERALVAELDARSARYASFILDAHAREESERFDASTIDESSAVIDLSSDDGAHADLREPAPYRRLRPAYTDAASRAEAEATVDAAVEIGSDGKVGTIEIVRWAGFGLDDEVIALIRRMHFRPAMRDGEPLAVRVLLRYNFRRPAQAKN